MTAQGTILGTFQYMAPEQLEGQEADARTEQNWVEELKRFVPTN